MIISRDTQKGGAEKITTAANLTATIRGNGA